MGTVVTDTDKIISKMKFILSFICIINKIWQDGCHIVMENYKKSYVHSQMRYIHAQKFV